MDAERLLVNFFHAQPVGHAIGALHTGTRARGGGAGPEVSLALNAATATELAEFCPFVSAAYPIDHPVRRLGVAPRGAAARLGLGGRHPASPAHRRRGHTMTA